jgi:hypothetical protein
LNAANRQKVNSSFDQSDFYSFKNNNNSLDPLFNETFKNLPLGGSTAKAEKKVIVNQYADMSRLLNRIDRLSPKAQQNYRPVPLVSNHYQAAAQSSVPYYKRNQKNEEGEC